MSEFVKFNSIENSYREKYIDILYQHGFGDEEYIAHEKIHGASSSFITDGVTVKLASRTQIVDGSFYNSQEVIDRISPLVLDLYHNEFSDAKQINVFGELFGLGIQKGVFYSNKKEFMAFDLVVDGIPLPILKAKMLYAKYNIPQVPYVNIFKNLEDALKESNTFVSKVSEVLGETCENKGYDGTQNFAEGLVIQPLEPRYTGNGSRVMIKNKTEKFTEKTGRKPKDPNRVIPSNPFQELSEQYVNENRLNAVLSKMGEVTNKDFGKIIGAMTQDVMDEMIKMDDLPADWKKKDEFKTAGKGVSTTVTKYLKENLLRKL